MTLFAVLAMLALLNVFGQRPVTSTAGGEDASLEVVAPTTLRGGVYFMGRFEISAAESIDDATLVLDPGWLESMHVNTIEPAPVEELAGEARQQQIASLDDIQWAVVEGSGKISFIPKSAA